LYHFDQEGWHHGVQSSVMPGAPQETALPAIGPTPLVVSRVLGRLLGLGGLWFKVEGCQPGGSWLDRGAVLAVAAACGEGARGLASLGGDALGPALALQAARAGLPLLLFVSEYDALLPDTAWAVALGARPIFLAADRSVVCAALPELAAGAGLRAATSADPLLRAGLLDAAREAGEQAGVTSPFDVLGVPALLGREGDWLAQEATAIAAPAEQPERTRRRARRQQTGIVVAGEYGSMAAVDAFDGPQPWRVAISTREADAARRLLAREEGLLASRRGVCGLAAIMRAARAKALPAGASALVLLADEVGGRGDGPPVAVDESLACEPLALGEVAGQLRHLLLMPPG
jgi:threonine synthase